jgi:hypothetical protein
MTGLQLPYIAAGLCGTFVFGRVMYTAGYSSGDPKKVMWFDLILLAAMLT